jgi:hypothetical protein
MTSPGPECTCAKLKKPWALTSRRQPPQGKVTVAGNLQSARSRISSASKKIFCFPFPTIRRSFSVAATSRREVRKVMHNGNFLILMSLFDLTDLDRIVRSQCSNLQLAAGISFEIHGRCAKRRDGPRPPGKRHER